MKIVKKKPLKIPDLENNDQKKESNAEVIDENKPQKNPEDTL